MFKAPARSKRRLAASIGVGAETLAGRLFDCAQEDLAAWGGPVCYAPAAPADAAWLETRLPGERPRIVTQPDGNLGHRLNHVNATLAGVGLSRQIFLGIDCPALDAGYLAAAAAALAAHDLVVGPAADGGAVLIATRHVLPPIETLPWSTAALGNALLARVAALGWRSKLLDARADIDTLEDLRAAATALETDERPARRALARWLATANETP